MTPCLRIWLRHRAAKCINNFGPRPIVTWKRKAWQYCTKVTGPSSFYHLASCEQNDHWAAVSSSSRPVVCVTCWRISARPSIQKTLSNHLTAWSGPRLRNAKCSRQMTRCGRLPIWRSRMRRKNGVWRSRSGCWQWVVLLSSSVTAWAITFNEWKVTQNYWQACSNCTPSPQCQRPYVHMGTINPRGYFSCSFVKSYPIHLVNHHISYTMLILHYKDYRFSNLFFCCC